MLGALLRIALELLGEQRVLAGVGAARPGAGDRVGRQPVALDLEQELGRRADDLEDGRPDEEQVRARVDPAERPVEPDPVERRAGRRVGRQVERLAPGEDDLDRLAGRDRVLGDLDGVDVLVAAEARLDRSPSAPATGAAVAGAPFARRPRVPAISAAVGRARPLERLEDRLLGDPVAALEVGRVGVERGDRRQRVGQVVEDEDEVGLDEGRRRDADRVALGQRHGRLEGRDRVVGERPDGAAGEARHPLGRLDAAARHERADGGQRVGRRRSSRSAGPGRRSGTRHRPGLDPGDAVAHLEQPARPDAQERVAAEPLAALDRLEQVGRVRRRRGAGRRRSGVSRSAGRVARSRIVSALAARRWACARLSGSAVVIAVGLGESRTTFVSGTKGRAFRGATLIRRCRTLVTDGSVACRRGHRSALPCIAGALRRSLLASAARAASRSVRRLPGPFPVVVVPARTSRRVSGSTSRRVLVPFTARSS